MFGRYSLDLPADESRVSIQGYALHREFAGASRAQSSPRHRAAINTTRLIATAPYSVMVSG